MELRKLKITLRDLDRKASVCKQLLDTFTDNQEDQGASWSWFKYSKKLNSPNSSSQYSNILFKQASICSGTWRAPLRIKGFFCYVLCKKYPMRSFNFQQDHFSDEAAFHGEGIVNEHKIRILGSLSFHDAREVSGEIEKLQFRMQFHLMKSLNHIALTNQLSLETDIYNCWIFISFQCDGNHHKIWPCKKTELHHATTMQNVIIGLRSAKFLDRWGAQHIGQLGPQISCHVTISFAYMLEANSIEPHVLI